MSLEPDLDREAEAFRLAFVVDEHQQRMRNLTSLPIACSLSPGDLQERLASIQQLTREALLSREQDGLVLTLRYAFSRVADVRTMVAREQQCCAFLLFEIREAEDAICVTITAPETARDAASELFAEFTTGIHAGPSSPT